MTRHRRAALGALLAAAVLLAGAPRLAAAGSTEPALAIAEARASSTDGVVSIVLTGNFDYGNATRLGYPLTVVLTQGTSVARLGLDGTVTLAEGADPPAPVAGAPGVVAFAAERLTAVVPPPLAGAGAVLVRLEIPGGGSQGTTLRSNTVEVQW